MVALRPLGWLPPAGLELAAAVQDILLGTALFGLGSAVRVRTLLHTGEGAAGRAGVVAADCGLGLAAALLIG